MFRKQKLSIDSMIEAAAQEVGLQRVMGDKQGMQEAGIVALMGIPAGEVMASAINVHFRRTDAANDFIITVSPRAPVPDTLNNLMLIEMAAWNYKEISPCASIYPHSNDETFSVLVQARLSLYDGIPQSAVNDFARKTIGSSLALCQYLEQQVIQAAMSMIDSAVDSEWSDLEDFTSGEDKTS